MLSPSLDTKVLLKSAHPDLLNCSAVSSCRSPMGRATLLIRRQSSPDPLPPRPEPPPLPFHKPSSNHVRGTRKSALGMESSFRVPDPLSIIIDRAPWQSSYMEASHSRLIRSPQSSRTSRQDQWRRRGRFQ